MVSNSLSPQASHSSVVPLKRQRFCVVWFPTSQSVGQWEDQGITYLLPVAQWCKGEALHYFLKLKPHCWSVISALSTQGAGSSRCSGCFWLNRMNAVICWWLSVLCKALFYWTFTIHSTVIPDQCWIFPTHQSSALAIDLSADSRWVSFNSVLCMATRRYWHHQSRWMEGLLLQGCLHLGWQL